MSGPPREPGTCRYILGEDGLARWPEPHAAAWLGFLQAHRKLTRELDAELERRHGLSSRGLELLGRLAAAESRRLRLTALAEQTGLSLSRISRMVDALERRRALERRVCPEDARATHAWLTAAGLRLVRDAQRTHFEDVQRRFFGRMDERQVRVLAAVFARLARP